MIEILVNGKAVPVPASTDLGIPLAHFLKCSAHCQSVKIGCAEGGCGSCAVQVWSQTADGDVSLRSVNSCLCPVGSVIGPHAVVTAEGLGNSRTGYNAVQERLAGFFATQCGFCTPGIAVACHTALQQSLAKDPQAPLADTFTQQTLSGNLCRCTGYRPIVDMCKSFCSNTDLEDLGIYCSSPDTVPSSLSAPTTNVTQLKEQDVALKTKVQATLADAKLRPHVEAALQANDLAVPSDDYCSIVPKPQSKQFSTEGPLLHGPCGSLVWSRPQSLPQLTNLLSAEAHKGQPVRLLAGNTGAGVYKNWPTNEQHVVDLKGVKELQGAKRTENMLWVGAVCTIHELAEALGEKAVDHPGYVSFQQHLRRIAGTHVQHAATLGGHLALARSKYALESDIVTPLLALEARVQVYSPSHAPPNNAASSALCQAVDDSNGQEPGADTYWLSIAEYMDADRICSPFELVLAVEIPVLRKEQRFWVYKVSERYANSHSLLNAAILTGTPGAPQGPPRAAVGFHGTEHRWTAMRLYAVENSLQAPLASAADVSRVLTSACEAASAAGATTEVQQLLEGVLLKGLAATYIKESCGDGSPLQQLFTRGTSLSTQVPVAAKGTQQFKADTSASPMGAVVQKEKSMLQASGEAQYTNDIPPRADALFGAFVTSTIALGEIAAICAEEALAIPGVIQLLTAKDVLGKNHLGACSFPFDTEPVFVDIGQYVQYHGQPICMVLATSQAVAYRAAKLVQVVYKSKGKPILDFDDALQQNAVYSLPFMGPMGDWTIKVGDITKAQTESEYTIEGTFELPAVLHMYMEPQVTVARPDEGGSMTVHAAVQAPTMAQTAIAKVLGCKLNDITMVTRRLGGGFGGKVCRAYPAMMAAVVGAAATGREVRVALNRNDDMRLTGGRCYTRVKYSVSFDRSGVLNGVQLQIDLQASKYLDMAWLDAIGVKDLLDSCYAVPNWDVNINVLACNIHPCTTMRGPGHAQAAFITQYLMHKVAEVLGMDEAAVHEINMLKDKHVIVQEDGSRVYKTPAMGTIIPESMFTASRVWQAVKESAHYQERKAEVDRFNAANAWTKRGISIMPTRFAPFVGRQVAGVSVYSDGSVIVNHSGIEMGQGLITKVKQVAVLELSKVLPEEQRPLPLSLVTTGPNSTLTLANHGVTGGSGTSEAACQAVRMACRALVERLQPFAEQVAATSPDFSWPALIATCFPMPGFAPLIQLQTLGSYGGTEVDADGNPTANMLRYNVFGAAVSEVKIEVLTGERCILRSDVVFDVGRSMNPGVDIGQVEGAFVMGCGMALTEEALYDENGIFKTDSTWNYKVPSATCVPQELNVQLLEDSDNPRGIYSSKACGEPPLQLAATVFTALRAATAAASKQLQELAEASAQTDGLTVPLPDWSPPATIMKIQSVLKRPPLGQLLSKQ